MICPMTFKDGETFDCLKKECAWWDEATKRCAIFRISVNLEGLIAFVKAIFEKM